MAGGNGYTMGGGGKTEVRSQKQNGCVQRRMDTKGKEMEYWSRGVMGRKAEQEETKKDANCTN